jgi:hypothetical protein
MEKPVRKNGSGSNKRRRSLVLTVRFNQQEAEALKQGAKESGVKPGTFLRQKALTGPALPPKDTAVDKHGLALLLRAITERNRQYSGLGNNLNQVVKAAHLGKVLENSIRAVLDELLPALRSDLEEERLCILQAIGKEPRRNHPAEPKE